MSKLQICQIGCGVWGRNILRDLLSLDCNVEVVDPDEEARKYAIEKGAKRVHASLPHGDQYDGFVVATSASAHCMILESIAGFEKPVFCEKPLVTSMQELERVQRLYGDNLFEMHKWRYHPGIERLAELAHSGELGELEQIRILRLGWGIPYDDVIAAYVLLPHDLSLLLSFLGYIPAVKKSICTHEGRPEAGMIIQLQDDQGPEVWLEYSILTPENKRSCTLVGSKATAQLANSYEEEIMLRRGAPGDFAAEQEVIDLDGPWPLWKELSLFVEYIKGGEPPFTPLSEAAEIMKRLEEITEVLQE